jgi:hypothetical protein
MLSSRRPSCRSTRSGWLGGRESASLHLEKTTADAERVRTRSVPCTVIPELATIQSELLVDYRAGELIDNPK